MNYYLIAIFICLISIQLYKAITSDLVIRVPEHMQL